MSNNLDNKIKRGEIVKKNNNTTIFIVIVLVIIAGLGIYFAATKNEGGDSNTTGTSQENDNKSNAKREIASTEGADIQIFYGSTCPHCKVVDEFIVKNDIDKVVPLQHLEVYENKQNQELMKQKLNECKDLSDDDKGGVPFMYSKEKCLVGDKPIIDFLKQKAGI